MKIEFTDLSGIVEICFLTGILGLLLVLAGVLLASEAFIRLSFCLFILATGIGILLMIFIIAND